MSSTRTSPTCQPAGAMMLNRITSVSVNAACPAANEIAAGATPATRIGDGSRIHSTVVLVPTSPISAGPDDEADDRADQPAQRVLSGVQGVGAQHRQRAETTQNECWTPVTVGDEDGQAEATRARTLLCSQTECRST